MKNRLLNVYSDSSPSTTQHKLEPWPYKYSMSSDVAHKITRENKQLYVTPKNNKKTKCIKIHTDLKNSEETTEIIPVEDNLAVVEVGFKDSNQFICNNQYILLRY